MTGSKQRQSIRQRWRNTTLSNQALVIISALSLIAVGAYAVTFIVQVILSELHRSEDRRPVVIQTRPPDIQSLTCDADGGRVTTGNMRVFVKNTQGDTATLRLVDPGMRIVPEQKTGKPWDNPPEANCDTAGYKSGPLEIPLLAGMENAIAIRQSAGSIPPSLRKVDVVQAYFASCIYYTERNGTVHKTCDTYRLLVPSDHPLDRATGTPSFKCDGTSYAGKLQQTLSGSCRN